MKNKALLLFALVLSVAGCTKADWKDASLDPSVRARALLAQMTLEEKIGQMCQYVGPCYVPPGQGSAHDNVDATDANLGHPDMADKIRAGKVGSFLHVLSVEEAAGLQRIALESRLGIPLLIGVDAIHGNALHEGCTIYPTSINLASTFHPALVEKMSAETASEMRQTGMYWTFAPNLDLARDARWGRMGETFGEDPFLVSEMGKAMTWGLQGRDTGYGDEHVLACAKHLIGGGEPVGGINAAPMDMSERKMRELYLPPFIAAVREAGVATVMAAHNELNGVPCHGNAWLLRDILRDEIGFDGFVVSDWMDIERMHLYHHWLPSVEEAFVVSVEAGIDMHMQGDGYFDAVLAAVRSGRLSRRRIDCSAGKILEAKFALGLFEHPVPDPDAVLANVEEHRRTALEAARQSLVLLKNNGVLPLSKPRRLLVCGPNADSQTILGDWAAPQPEENVITALKGIMNLSEGIVVDTMCFGGKIRNIDDRGIQRAAAKAAQADVAILVLGENSQRYSSYGRTCGENCDRDDLILPGRQQALLEAVCATGKPVVLVLLTGRALGIEWASEYVDAILNAWEPGMMGGQAIAEVLFGFVNPSGKLPVTFPRNVGQIQTVYNYKPMQYSRQYALSTTGALYPFGFGLSYTTFDCSAPFFIDAPEASGINITDLPVRIGVDVTNTGTRDGEEVVQLYVRDEYASATRPVKELKAFQRVAIPAGETVRVSFTVTADMLALWSCTPSGEKGHWTVEPGDFTLLVGSSSADADLKPLKFSYLRKN